MNILKQFAKEYNKINNKPLKYGNTLQEHIKYTQNILLKEEFKPSNSLKSVFDKLSIRSKEPLKVAITGEFSSGKSTFLNALLSKDILPTGITPVTSKVNFIKYGKKRELEIVYSDGRVELRSPNELRRYTDQRESIEDIKYLNIYLPQDILKEITFVDTPGLNSQSIEDTRTTTNVLKDVDGIIWLTLIDNAGKLSEEKALAKFLKYSNIKSLCVLNQKDRFTKSQIDTTIKYIKENFDKYFDEVIAISAKEALDARKNDKNQILAQKIDNLASLFKKSLLLQLHQDISFFDKSYKHFLEEANEVLNQDFTHHLKLLENSNIQKVLDFIDEHIRANATISKEKSIKRELIGICDIIIEQYNIIMMVHDKLSNIIIAYKKNLNDHFETPKKRYANELYQNHQELEKIISLISNEIYANMITIQKYRYKKSVSKFLKKPKIEQIPYKMPWFESENIYKTLFYDEDKVEKLLRRVTRELKEIESNAIENITSLYENLEAKIKQWQNLYEFTTKNREIASEKEFAHLRKFVSKAYEDILKDFMSTSLESVSHLEHDFGYIKGALEFNYQNAAKTTVAFFKRRIYESVQFYEDYPESCHIYTPSLNEIEEQIKIHFNFNKLDSLIKSKRNFLYKNIENLQENYKSIAEEKIKFLNQKKEEYLKKIDTVQKLKEKLSAK